MSHAKLIFVYIGWNTPCVSFELLFNKCLFNICMFIFRLHAGGLFGYAVSVLAQRWWAYSCAFITIIWHALGKKYISSKQSLGFEGQPKPLDMQCIDGNAVKRKWFTNNPHWTWVCCMDLFWSAFITWVSSICQRMRGAFRCMEKDFFILFMHTTIYRSSWWSLLQHLNE